MAWVVVGGQSRNVGKTAAVCGLIAAFPDRPWTAVKITQFGHGVCSRSGHACDCACEGAAWLLSPERNRLGRKDTARFLRSGARRVWWLRCRIGELAAALPALEAAVAGDPWVICESNSLVALRRPKLYLTLLDPRITDWKASARALLPRADARLIVSGAAAQPPPGPAERPARLGPPAFPVSPPAYLSPALLAWLRSRLAQS